jgi:membrane protease YdiL (CAAX protease family)
MTAADDRHDRDDTWFFFTVALGFTLVLQLPAALATLGVLSGPAERFMPLMALGVFGPVIGAVAAAFRDARGQGVRRLFAPSAGLASRLKWIPVALLVFPAAHVAGAAVYRLFGGDPGPWFLPPLEPGHFAGMLIIPLAEEPGWRGYALPRMQRRYGGVRATLLLGVLWAAWHTDMFIIQGMTPTIFLAAVIQILVGSFAFTWFYNRSGGSLLIAIMGHVGAHIDKTSLVLPEEPGPMLVQTGALAVLAVVLLVTQRGAFPAPRRPR